MISHALILFFILPAAAEPPVFSLTLAQAEKSAREHSLEIKAALEESAASRDRAEAQFASLLPRLTLEGSYRYKAETPSLSILPGTPARPFEDNRATSIGPTVSWTLWDQSSLYKSWKAQQVAAKSQEERERLVETEAVLGARLAYFQVQLSREQVWLLADSVALAAAQYQDIGKRLRAGAASRIDSLSSHQVELARRKDFLQAQANLGASLRQLFLLTGAGRGLDPSRPVDVRVSGSIPEGLPSPTLSVELDALTAIPRSLSDAQMTVPDASHPGVAFYARQAESSRLSGKSFAAGQWPKIQATARLSYDYPNGPVFNSVVQKAVGLTASLPLFEGRQSARQADGQARLAKASDRRKEFALEELLRDWDKARLTLAALRDQQALDERSVAESEDLSSLVYISYKAGRSTFLEVQTYNLAALQAKVQAAQTRAQILIQLATLAQLSSRG